MDGGLFGCPWTAAEFAFLPGLAANTRICRQLLTGYRVIVHAQSEYGSPPLKQLARAVKKNAALDADRYKTLAGKLEYFDLRELQDTITGKEPWVQFEARFGTKEALNVKFDQLAELRNGIRHSRAVSEVVRKEGEAAILWFRQVLTNDRAAMLIRRRRQLSQHQQHQHPRNIGSLKVQR
jgi:hypothetical protein